MALRRIALLSGLAPMLFLAACGGGGGRHSITEKYYLVATNVKIPYWQTAAAGFSRAASDMGIKSAAVVGPETHDPKGQLDALRKVINENPAPAGILVSASDAAVLKPGIDEAIGKGIPVITIDSDAPDSKRLYFIGTNNYEAGRMAAQVAARQLKGKGNVVVYTIPGQPNLEERWNGYQEVFSANPGIRVVQTIDVKGDPRIAFDRTMELVDKKVDADAFVCLEATACEEVAEVLNRRNIKDKVVVAMDTDERTLEWIEKGLISATVAQRPYTMGYFGLKLLEDMHRSRAPALDRDWTHDSFSPVPARIDTGATLIDRSNASAYLQQMTSETAR